MISIMVFLDLLDSPEEQSKYLQVYEKYHGLVRWVAEQLVHRQDITEECVQDTFFNVAKNFHKIGDVDSPQTRSYIATIARGVAIKAYNKEHRAAFVYPDNEEEMMSYMDPNAVFGSDTFTSVELSDAMQKVLNNEERSLIELKYVYGYKVSELSKMYHTTDYFINKQINHAIKQLRIYFTKED